MVKKHEIQLDEIDLLTLDMPPVKQGNSVWEPLYGSFTPKEINESTIESAKQEIFNQIDFFETLQYFNMVCVGCDKTA
jgi:hypothetical protein